MMSKQEKKGKPRKEKKESKKKDRMKRKNRRIVRMGQERRKNQKQKVIPMHNKLTQPKSALHKQHNLYVHEETGGGGSEEKYKNQRKHN